MEEVCEVSSKKDKKAERQKKTKVDEKTQGKEETEFTCSQKEPKDEEIFVEETPMEK